MAIAFDNQLNTQVDSSVTSVTRSLTVTGANPMVFTWALVTGAADADGVTYNGVSLTKAGEVNRDSFSTEAYYLLGASTGANNLVWSRASSGTWVTTATSYSGVKSSFTPATNTNNATSASMTGTISTSADNSWIIMASRTNGQYPDPTGTNYTRRAFNTANGVHIGDTGGSITPAGSTTQTVSISGSVNWHIFQMTVEPEPSAGGFAYSQAVIIA